MFLLPARRLALVMLVVAAAAAGSGCDEVKDPFHLTATPITYTENFNGTLTTGASANHPFTVLISGTVTLTLTSVAPDSAQKLGFDIGTWDGTTCNPIFGTGSKDATQGYTLSGPAVAPNFCARIHDGLNRIPAETTVSYTVKVDHP